MKRCPRCGQIYSDDLLYCLQDGASLLLQEDDGSETPTVVRSPRGRGTSYVSLALIAAAVLLFACIAGGLGAYFVWKALNEGEEIASQTASSPSPVPSASPGRTPSPAPRTPPPAPERPPNPEANLVDPGPARIAFRRGRESETVSGWVNSRREFLLRTVAGQSLRAEVTSELGCVFFADGGSSVEFSTPQGDSRIAIRNNCPAPVRFRLSVTVR